MNFHELYRRWMESYSKNAEHALRDAETNLKGFTRNLKSALQLFSVDYAFSVAIRRTLRQNGVN